MLFRRSLMPVAFAFAAFAAAACYVPRLDTPEGLDEAYPWIAEGRTSRAELIEKLGEPVVEFEAGRLAGWRLEGAGEFSRSTPGEIPPKAYSLVVAFDSSGIVERLRVIPYR